MTPARRDGDIIESMRRIPLTLILLCACNAAALADEEPQSITVIGGANASLVAAADALRIGDAETAIRFSLQGLEDALSLDDRAGALSNLCGAYTLAEQYELAIASCTEALATDERWQAYHNRALAYLHERQLDAAARDIEAGLALYPESRLLAKARAALEDMRQRNAPPPVTSITSL
jgi:tetratricopeptide (TPR) repeat protein